MLIGASSPSAMARVGRWGNGYIAAGLGPTQQVNEQFRQAKKYWQSAGRRGKPRLVGGAYYALGPEVAERAKAYILNTYGFLGLIAAQQIASFVATTPEALQTRIQEFAESPVPLSNWTIRVLPLALGMFAIGSEGLVIAGMTSAWRRVGQLEGY